MHQDHFLPINDYCDVVWVPTNVGHLKRLERLHSYFSPVDLTSSSVFKLTLDERRRSYAATKICKILQNLPPFYLHSTFSYAVSITGRTGHNVHQLYIPFMHLNYGKNSLYYRITAIWNSLPASVMENNSLNSFKLAYLTVCI